jgi:hypothetical protein
MVLTWARRPRNVERQMATAKDATRDLVAIVPLRDFTCVACGDTGWLLVMEDAGPHCLSCVDLDHLVFLPAGDAALSRRARRESGLSAIVVKFSRSRKRYERQGILVEPQALERAEQQCLGDEDARRRRRERDRLRREADDVTFQARMAAEIVRLFPGCPKRRAERIAMHAGQRGSGRVGRSAAGRALDDNAITLSVVASVRHEDTEYDRLLMAGVPRIAARERVWPAVDRVLHGWRAAHPG